MEAPENPIHGWEILSPDGAMPLPDSMAPAGWDVISVCAVGGVQQGL